MHIPIEMQRRPETVGLQTKVRWCILFFSPQNSQFYKGIYATYLVEYHRGVYKGPATENHWQARKKLLSIYFWALLVGLFVAACTNPPPAPPAPDLRKPATIKDIMDSMVNPSGEFIFESVQKIADEHGISEKAPKTDAEWEEVRRHLFVLLEAPNLLITEGRKAARPEDRSKNPEVENQPEEVQKLLDADRPSFIRRARRLQDAAALAMKAVDAKDKDALFQAIEGIDKACENCHLHYWYPNDKRARDAAKQDGITE
jgi:hypothetical protein